MEGSTEQQRTNAGEGAACAVEQPHTELTLADLRAQLASEAGARRQLEQQLAEQARLVVAQGEQLARARERVAASSRAKAAFLAMMSHEIRTPLNGIIGTTEFLLDTALSEEQRDCTLTIARSGAALLELINDILDFSKVEAGRMQLESVEIDLPTLIENAVEVVAERAQRKGLELACVIDPDVPTCVNGDPVRLRQVLLNLLGNAVKFTASGEVVLAVELERQDPRVARLCFSVRDTGIGIAADRLSAVFEPFVQADASTARRFGGTGLGLAITKQLVELMGGAIAVESEPGAGSTFRCSVALPCRGPDAQDPAFATVHGARAICADRHAAGRRSVVEHLRHLGLRAEGVATVEEVVASLKEGPPARVVLIDCRALEAAPEPARQLALHLSRSGGVLLALAPLTRRAECAGLLGNAAAACTVQKPVRRSQLRRVLARALGLADDPAGGVPSAGRGQGATPQARHVLVVEDNPINQKVALGMLKKLGHTAEVAADGVQALAALAERTYDLVLLDCQMPEKDGYEVARELRQREPPGESTPLIAMTANAMPGDRERCLAAGMDDYLTKPVTFEALRRMIDSWASRRRVPDEG